MVMLTNPCRIFDMSAFNMPAAQPCLGLAFTSAVCPALTSSPIYSLLLSPWMPWVLCIPGETTSPLYPPFCFYSSRSPVFAPVTLRDFILSAQVS